MDKKEEYSIPKISIDEQIRFKYENIDGDFKELEINPNIDRTISTVKNALFHINSILKNIADEIKRLDKRIDKISPPPIL